MDEQLHRLAAAFTSAKEGQDINYQKLLKNTRNCCRNVNNNEQKSKILRAIVLSCPHVRELEHPDLQLPHVQSIVIAFPEMSSSTFVLLSQALSYQSLIYSVLITFPSAVTMVFLKTTIERSGSTYTPVNMLLFSELCKVLIHLSLAKPSEMYNFEEIHKIMSSVLKALPEKFNNKLPKNDSYIFFHCIDLLKFIASPVSVTMQSVSNDACHNRYNLGLTLLQVCQKLVCAVNVNVWMSWSEIPLVHTHEFLYNMIDDSSQSVTVQTVISHISHELLSSVSHLNYCTNEHHNKKYCIQTALHKFTELHEFLKQVAKDPRYDPDSELSLSQLVESLNELKLDDTVEDGSMNKKTRQDKLTSLLLLWNNSKELFESNDTPELFCNTNISENNGKILLNKYLAYNNSISSKWKEAIINGCKALEASTLEAAVASLLSRGVVQDWLCCEYFPEYLRAACNTVVSGDVSDQMACVWLACIQKPYNTLEALIEQALSQSGMVAVTIHILQKLHIICNADILPEEETNFKVNVLAKIFQGLSFTQFKSEKEEERMIELLTGVCGNIPGSNCVVETMMRRVVANLSDRVAVRCLQTLVTIQPGVAEAVLTTDQTTELLLSLMKHLTICSEQSYVTNGEESMGIVLDGASGNIGTVNEEENNPFQQRKSARETVELQECFKEIASRIIQHVIKDGTNAGSTIVKAILSRRECLTASSVALLYPLLAAYYAAPLPVIQSNTQSSRVIMMATLLFCHSSKHPDYKQRLRDTTAWSYPHLVSSMCQVLMSAPYSDWRTAIDVSADILNSSELIPQFTAHTVPKPVGFQIKLLRDVLFLVLLSTRSCSCSMQTFYSCYRYFTDAVTEHVKDHIETLAASEQFDILGKVINWWFKNYIPCQDNQSSAVLCLKLLDLLREVAVSHGKNEISSYQDTVVDISVNYMTHMRSNKLGQNIAVKCRTLFTDV